MAPATRSDHTALLATTHGGGPLTAIVVLMAGFALGVVTVLGQMWLAGGWLALANSGALWLAPAFFVGAGRRSDLSAAGTGAGLLIAAVLGYYGSVPFLVEGASASSRSVAIWLATALVGGPVYGVAGRWWWRSRGWRGWAAAGLLGGAFLAEGASRLRAGDDAAGWTMVVVGVVLPLILGRTGRDRLLGLAATIPVVVVTAMAYAVINWAFLNG